MESVDVLTKGFKAKYESFLIGCDAIEEMGQWDKEAFGEMDVFYESDLGGMILRLIAADGEICGKEVEYVNKNFGFDYTEGSLKAAYESCHEGLVGSFDENFKKGYLLMKKINAKLADAYKDLLGTICDIVIASDGEISPEEIEEAKRIKALI